MKFLIYNYKETSKYGGDLIKITKMISYNYPVNYEKGKTTKKIVTNKGG